MSKVSKKKGRSLMITGLLLVAAAFFLAGYNLWDEARAKQITETVAEQLETVVATKKEEVIADYEKFPEIEMTEMTVDGNTYIGVLKIPVLGLKLPVMSEWSYPRLKAAPCRYEGSAYQNDLVIAAHNYECHFGNIKSLAQGEQITFTDMDGNEFHYEVTEIEVLDSYAVEEMTSGDWDLTLFTCTYGGQERVTVRCIRSEYIY